MNAQELIDTARTLVAGDKGLLAMDERNPTCNKRFARHCQLVEPLVRFPRSVTCSLHEHTAIFQPL